MLAGQLAYIGATLLHTGGEANDHHAIFEAYADSAHWGTVHLAQLIAMAILLAGLLALSITAETESGLARLRGRMSGAATIVALALLGMLQAIDGVALKQAVNALVAAPESEKAARFAAAETIRWLEWGARSLHDFALGLALLLAAAALSGAATKAFTACFRATPSIA
jgi:hypothetical protein